MVVVGGCRRSWQKHDSFFFEGCDATDLVAGAHWYGAVEVVGEVPVLAVALVVAALLYLVIALVERPVVVLGLVRLEQPHRSEQGVANVTSKTDKDPFKTE